MSKALQKYLANRNLENDRRSLRFAVYSLSIRANGLPKIQILGVFHGLFDAKHFIHSRKAINPKGDFEIIEINVWQHDNLPGIDS